jgi:hypothetical protein
MEFPSQPGRRRRFARIDLRIKPVHGIVNREGAGAVTRDEGGHSGPSRELEPGYGPWLCDRAHLKMRVMNLSWHRFDLAQVPPDCVAFQGATPCSTESEERVMKNHLYPQAAWLQATVMAVGISIFLEAGAAAKADGALATPPVTHCKWGDFGCTNPPPDVAPQGAAPVSDTMPLTGTGAGRSALACNKDLSTPGECWTNCKTEDEITICDIISLDTFWPESPQTKPTKFTGETVKKTVHGRPAVGRVMTAAR